MREYNVYFQIGKKKMKSSVLAENEDQAKEIIKE